MLAIKECLIREGALNLSQTSRNNKSNDNDNNNATSSSSSIFNALASATNTGENSANSCHTPYNMYDNDNRLPSKLLDNHNLSKSVSTSNKNDFEIIESATIYLNSASATAKKSCQQQKQLQSDLQSQFEQQLEQQQQKQHQQEQQQQQINQKNTTGTKRYQGHHPHFHHHTTPAYYTDLHLRIHTPEAKDSLNENYQSVYRTPTNLVKDERQFPKSSTATVAPPPISGKNSTKSDSINNNNNNISTEKLNKAATSAFFRGGTAIKEPQKISEIYARSSPTSATNPVKGNLDIDSPRTARIVASSIVTLNNVTSTAEHKTQSLNKPISGSTSAERSRNCKRFSNRKKVVRVRSESRPISALYEIICKETGHDLFTTSTNDEDSSSESNISDDENIRNYQVRRSRRSHSSSLSRQNKPHGTGNSSTMSGGLENSSGGDFPQQKPNAQLKKNNPIYINDLSEDDDDLVHIEGGCSRKNLRLRVTQKTTNLLDDKRQPRKVASLPHNQISQETHHHIPQQFHIYIPSVETSSSSNAPIRNFHSLKQVDSSSSEHKKELPNISSSNKSSSNNNIGCTIPLVGATDLQGNEECSAQDEMKTGADKSLTLFPTASTPYETLMSPKGARFTRKHKRNRDEKQRRHTVSSIKLTNDASENDDQLQQQQQQQKKQQQYNQDLNGAGHENHALPPTNASKRYITRNQRNNSSGLNGNVSPHSVHAVTPSDSLPPPELGAATVTATATTIAETSAIIKNKRAIATGGKPTTIKSTKLTTKATTINSDKQHIDMTNSAKVSATSAKNASPTELKSSSAIGGAGSCGGGGGGGVQADSNGTLSNATATTTSSTTSIPNRNMQIPDKKKDDPTSPKHHLMLNASVSLGASQGISNSDSEQQGNKLSSPTTAYNNRQQSVIGKKSAAATASCYANRSRSINLKTNSACILKTLKQKSQNSDTTTIKTKEPKISKSSTLSSQMIRKDDIKFIKNIYGEQEEVEEEQRYEEEDEEIDDDDDENDDDDDDDRDDNNDDNDADDYDRDNDDDRDDGNDEEEYEEDDMLEINDLPAISMNFTKPLYSPNVVSLDINNTLDRMETLDARKSLDKVRKCNEERDKSSKRKSNLNRSLNEEAAFDNDESAALRRRRRRELGMARQLVPGDNEAIAVRDLISPQKCKCIPEDEKTKVSPIQICYLDMTHKGIDATNTTKNQTANDNGYDETYKGMYTLGYHMEMARKGQDKINERRRGQISSPRKEKTPPKAISKPNRINDPALLDDLKMQRSSDVNRKVNERTRADLADIIKIAELANECTQSTCNAISILNETVNLLRVSQVTVDSEGERKPSPAKHATFLEEECIYYEPYPLENCDPGTDNDDENLQASPVGGGILRTQRMLKARSVEGDVGYEMPKLSPILRRKSTDDPAGGISAGTSQIVSILKKKDHLSAGDSSSASSNASPVTFSSNVVDTPTKQKRAGILKKRSSLDESRYYSRSHSPDERSILVKSARRNSLEETAAGSTSTTSGHHGILKQSSYDSNKSDGCPSASGESSQPHSILKKKDSTSTPCDGASGHSSKHVSISQAVILAAAELYAAETGTSPSSNGNDSLGFTPNNEEYELRPILKPETPSTDESIRPPKPILKKKSLGDSDEHEIKPILKTSRKSSREESDLSNVHGEGEQSGEPLVKPILKTDSPSKRRSLGDADHTEEDRGPDSLLLKRRTRSLERQDGPVIDLGEALNAIATSQTQANELATTLTNSVAGQNFSVAERIKCMEKFLNFTSAGNQTRDSITSLDLPCVVASAPNACFKQVTPNVNKRELYKDRFKTQPVTNEEKNAFKSDASVSHTTTSTTSTKSLEGLCGSPSLPLFNTQINRQQPNVSPFFTLTRSPTQSVQTSVVIKSSSNFSTPSQSAFTSIAASAISASSTPSSPVNNLAHKTSTNSAIKSINMSSVTDILELSPISGSDNNTNITNNASESRIIEMSSLELDVDMPEMKSPESQTNASSTCGIVRTNSVRARANMFQQLQKKPSAVNSNREERTSPKRVTSRPSPSSTIVIRNNNNNDHANKTLQIANNSQRTLNTTDDEIEPSTLSLSARLRFFSSLSDTSIRSPGPYSRGSPPYSSIDSSSNGSSCTYLTTQRSTASTGSFNSLTSTPMDYTSTVALESPSVSLQEIVRHRPLSLQLTPTGHEHNSLPSYDHADAASAVIKPDIVKTSPFLQGKIPNKTDPVSSIIEQPITPTSTLTPTMKRIKLKIIGKLMLPRTFQSNDRNNNIDKESKLVSDDDDDTVTESGFDCTESDIAMPPKKIGKIKSLFIENCNQLPLRQTLPSSNKYMKMDLKSPPYNMLGSLENSMTNGHFNALPDNNSNGKLNSVDNKSEQHHSDESSNDSGKENIDVLVVNEHTKSVVETRRKFSRKPPNSNSNSSNNNNNNNNNNNSNNINNQSLCHGNSTSHSRPLSQQLNSNSMIENGKTPSPNNHLSNKFAKYFGETVTAERQISPGNFTQHSRPLSQQLSSNSMIENGKTSLPNNHLSNKFAKYFGETVTAERQMRTTLTKSKSFSSTYIKSVPDVCQVKPQTPRNDIIKDSYDVRRTPSIQTTSQRSLVGLRKGHLWSNYTPIQQHSRRGIKRRSPVYQKITNYDQIIVTEDELKNADQAFDQICRTMDDSEIQQFSEEFDKLFKNIL